MSKFIIKVGDFSIVTKNCHEEIWQYSDRVNHQLLRLFDTTINELFRVSKVRRYVVTKRLYERYSYSKIRLLQ